LDNAMMKNVIYTPLDAYYMSCYLLNVLLKLKTSSSLNLRFKEDICNSQEELTFLNKLKNSLEECWQILLAKESHGMSF